MVLERFGCEQAQRADLPLNSNYNIMNVMARYPSAHKPETRARILAAADRLLKERGAEAASIEAVMKAAGLTVGGFYAHFASKRDLEREALLHGLDASMEQLLGDLEAIADDRAWVAALVHRYLHQGDAPGLANACPLTLLLPDVARGGASLQAALSERTGALLNRVADRFPERHGRSRREVAVAVFASCIGAVALARTIPAPHGRSRVLDATEAMLAAFLDDGDARGPDRRAARVKSRRSP